MATPIAIQLFTVREQLAQDFVGTVHKLAEIGYAGVETASFPEGVDPEEAGRLFRQLELTVVAAHLPLPLGSQKAQVLETAAALGCSRLVLSYLPPEEYENVDQVLRNVERINQAVEVAAAHGLSLGIHNHWWEFRSIAPGGQTGFDVLIDELYPSVFFELDVYWAQTAGHDPVSLIRQLGQRAPLLHIKDGPATVDAPMTAVGHGVLDIPSIVAAAHPCADWLIAELDRSATDMMEAVRASIRYLETLPLASGRD